MSEKPMGMKNRVALAVPTVRKRTLGTAVASGALAVAAVLGAGGQALAGTNGQQIRIVDYTGRVNSVKIIGQVQKGQPRTYCLATPHKETSLVGWWWRDYTRLAKWTDSSCGADGGTYLGSQDEWVKATQYDSDWTGLTIYTNTY
ncbi:MULTISPECIES: hypothetical protein [Streptomyces]|uniref:hypothetical protein n=1 Tax=Streptomyces TaxID=1883 RepID=UPI00163B6DBE|nr:MULTISPECIES: hypothetical protein [Streptomyces]MBC2878321.1 hypothetical protein [Streptomyces sp. TYQ1024]UBI40563.1 hypothetical protein K7I03_31620 [Streptomyces mobaraensis]UKW33144.1 hypothetical protein MCU78_31540 [Streptomyces sp. TYQ1024]